MVFVRTVGCPELLLRQLPGGHQLGHPQVFALGISLVLILRPADGRAVRCDIGVEAQVTDAVLEGEDLRLSVQRQLQGVKECRDRLLATLQVLLTGMDQPEIVHISAVELDSQLAFDQLIHTV